MSNEIDWSKAPVWATEARVKRGAVRFTGNGKVTYKDGTVHVDHIGLKAWGEVIATRPDEPARKTVKDAVKYYGAEIARDNYRFIRYNESRNTFFTTPTDDSCTGWMTSYQVCTRDEFEAEVERQKGEWTHECSGEKCKYIVQEQDSAGYVIVIGEDGEYYRERPEDIKPIKPAISKSEADFLRNYYKWINENDKSGFSSELAEEYIALHDIR